MKVVVRIAFLIAGLLLWVSDARSQSADVFPKDGIRVEQRLARQTSIRNFRRDIEAFKRSKKRAMRVFLQEKAQEIQSLRSSSSARKVSLRRALDLNRDGRITRGEQLSGRNLIKALRREDRSLWVSYARNIGECSWLSGKRKRKSTGTSGKDLIRQPTYRSSRTAEDSGWC